MPDPKLLLIDVLRRIVREDLKVEVPDADLDQAVALSVPNDPGHGDLTTTAPLKLARLARRKPRELADAIADALRRDAGVASHVAAIEVAGPGFINFTLARDTLIDLVRRVHSEGARFGPPPVAEPKRILIEFVSANPTGPLVVVGGRQAAVGDVLANLLAAVGHQVSREYYINDSGTQMTLFGRSVLARYQEAAGLAAQVPEDGYHGEYLIDLAREIRRLHGDRFLALPEDQAVRELAALAADLNVAGIRQDLADFRVVFDRWYSQAALEQSGAPQRLLDRLAALGLSYEKDGAVWMRTSAFGDTEDRVLVKSNGDLTYRTTDLAYHEDKFARGHNVLIDFWGPDHHAHVITMTAALRALGHDVASFHILIVQHCTLLAGGQEVKMSKRAGQVVRLRELVDDVGVDAARWFFVMRRTDSHLDFDLALAKEKSPENPVYYVQYAHARISSLFAKAREKGHTPVGGQDAPGVDLGLLTDRDRSLIAPLGAFGDVVAAAAREYEPQRLTNYLYDLATQFHSWYTYGDRRPECRVLVEDQALTRARLHLVAAVQQVIANGLRLLGVAAPESM
jgi:arginyl-tRNA synthetase